MKIEVVYVFPVNAGEHYTRYAERFLASYASFKTGTDHGTTIVVNGGQIQPEYRTLFSLMPDCKFIQHDNSGYDIGAFQFAARTVPCDMMVFFGTSAYIQVDGWLMIMAQTFSADPRCQYGCMGNVGEIQSNVWPHIRTTGFWMNPSLMNSYPFVVTLPEQRHPFEHGQNCFTEWLKNRGIKSYVVTRRGRYEWRDWNSDPNGFQRGNQSSLLTGDRMCEPPYYNVK